MDQKTNLAVYLDQVQTHRVRRLIFRVVQIVEKRHVVFETLAFCKSIFHQEQAKFAVECE